MRVSIDADLKFLQCAVSAAAHLAQQPETAHVGARRGVILSYAECTLHAYRGTTRSVIVVRQIEAKK